MLRASRFPGCAVRAAAGASHTARVSRTAGSCGRKDARELHAGSSPVDADQSGGHNPRPPVTIRQHERWAAVVGGGPGPTMPRRRPLHGLRDCGGVRPPAAAVPECADSPPRPAWVQVEATVGYDCATGDESGLRNLPRAVAHQLWIVRTQRPRESAQPPPGCQLRTRPALRSLPDAGDTGDRAPRTSLHCAHRAPGHPGVSMDCAGARCRGRVCGRGDHGADHGFVSSS